MKHTISTNREKLTIQFDDSERETLRQAEEIQSDKAMIEFLEPLTCNSELDWIDPSETGDLTSAPMLAIKNEAGQVLERWAFMDYQVRSVLEDLRDKGQAVFIGGPLKATESKTGIETAEYTLPAYWASYLINGDASGISAEDKAQADKFVESHNLGGALSCSDQSWFSHRNDSGNGLAGDVMDFVFPVLTAPKFSDLDEFTRGYITCALWSSNDESTPQGGEPFDKNYGPEDIALETLRKMVQDCAQFQADNAETLDRVKYPKNDSTDLAHAGHDFWLTRCGHGAGFWDGDLPEDIGDALTKSAKKFGNVGLYLGDDGKIYS